MLLKLSLIVQSIGSTHMNFMNCFETVMEKQRHVQERNIYCLFKNANVEMIPQQYILRRWTKNLIPATLRNKRNSYCEKNVVVENFTNEETSIVDHCVHLLSKDDPRLEPDEWIKDSGCSKNMIGNRKFFSTYKAYNGGNVIFGSNLRGNIIGKGRGIRKKGLYVMKLGNKTKDKICLATIDENSTLWHRRLGYANMRLI
nr:protein FAR1-related sequence 5 [Tanacetum cinerariifolium]